MEVHLKDYAVSLVGDSNRVAIAAIEALLVNGGRCVPIGELPEILLVSFPLLPEATAPGRSLMDQARDAGLGMAERGRGRIVVLTSVLALLPMRRYSSYSADMAGILAAVRGLAMELAPHVLVNAVGLGAIGEPLISGEAAMLGHAAQPRAGLLDEAVSAVLFMCDPMNSYMTGQMLSVDGGWSAGFARTF